MPAVKLCTITLAAGLALGGVYQLTKGPIEKAELAAQAEAYAAVCPDAESFDTDEKLEETIASLTAEDGTVADGKFGNVVYESAYAALDAEGVQNGYVVNVTSKEGFGGDITLSIGFDSELAITGMEFLAISETAGLGMRATEDTFKDQYIGDAVEEFELTKDAAKDDTQIQAMSGATVTSTAVTNAVNAALYLVNSAAE
ncbi:MAG: RnfABCDGE type electron transport complex subunit G [Eubacteriales bacterium]|nr:RnfABCDGE type electron transport complex subunit G [Eubacteriales bacterium]